MAGRFVWYDLVTTDVEAAWAFYSEVVGWKREPFGDSGYGMLVGEAGPIGGIEGLSDEAKAMGAPPHWLGYVSVDDVDASAQRVGELGGKLLREPTDIPGVGRFAVIQDPTGAVVAVFRSGDGGEGSAAPVAPGAMVWHECYAGELEGAWAFYTALFGWESSGSMQMGQGQEYRMYRRPGDEGSIGGMMTVPEMMPAPGWLYYAHVDDIAAAAARVTAAGGQLVMGPMEIPGGEYTLMGIDPQGAGFALHSKLNSAA